MNSDEIRSRYLDFFADNDHEVMDSAPLLPTDPELLFNIAGMVPFKPYFLGDEEPPANRVTTSQKCLRTTDIENVGHTARHQTFFEMLGNFSFGDYFKEEAICLAWEFLVDEMSLDPEKLWIGVFGGDVEADLQPDEEAFRLWNEKIGVSEKRILKFGRSENFWAMNETGPCGPCSEIHYNLDEPGAEPDEVKRLIEAGADSILELWNLVFMQYNRDENGDLSPLPRQNIDTGLGLERLAVVKQDKLTNFETDLFRPIMDAAESMAEADADETEVRTGLRIVADHVRAASFLLAEGLLPGNEGRGYVLRRLIRRAARWGRKLSLEAPFLDELVPVVVDIMGDHYSELEENQELIVKNLRREEEQFNRTLDQGLGELEEKIYEAQKREPAALSGEEIFGLYETHGLPVEMTVEALSEAGINYEREEIQEARKQHQRRSRELSEGEEGPDLDTSGLPETDFVGYDKFSVDAEVLATYKNGERSEQISPGEDAKVVLERSPFYAEQGGQVGDTGYISGFQVEDTVSVGNVYLHSGVADEKLEVGEGVTAQVDVDRRNSIKRHHTATHLLQAALREELGEQVMQSGSRVGPGDFRFDFTHNERLDRSTLARIESRVNEWIHRELQVETEQMNRRRAEKEGALAFFGEHYGETVRVVRVRSRDGGSISKELCGGTHVNNTSSIGVFTITDETSVAAGVRRIEARCGGSAYQYLSSCRQQLSDIRRGVGVQSSEDVLPKIEEYEGKIETYEEELEKYRQKHAASRAEELIDTARSYDGVNFVYGQFTGEDEDTVKKLLDSVREKMDSGLALLANRGENSVQLLLGVSEDLVPELDAGDLVGKLGRIVGGGGGGRPDFAQAGGSQPEALPEVEEEISSLLEEKYGPPDGD